jgi:DNA-binding CsgD family transcriptional regulator
MDGFPPNVFRRRCRHFGFHVSAVLAASRPGARGYVLKDAPLETFVAAVRAAGRGQSSLPPSATTRVVDRFAILAQREVDPDALTERELEILARMAKGTPYKEIAAQLNVTTHTVQYRVTNILRKLHVGNWGEAVAAAAQRGCSTKRNDGRISRAALNANTETLLDGGGSFHVATYRFSSRQTREMSRVCKAVQVA